MLFRVICAKLLARKLAKLAEQSNDKQLIRVICWHQQPMDPFIDVYTPYRGKTKKMIQALLKETDKLELNAALYFNSLENYNEAVGRSFLVELCRQTVPNWNTVFRV
ncbi:MAG: hypothetical protein K6B70_07635 [Clostridia bacterium]|nr:hypothetical protein [Clostridia bacterium]